MERTQPAARAVPALPAAFSIQLGRNLVVQALGVSMVSLMGLTVAPWPVVLGWALLAIAALGLEHRFLALMAGKGRFTRAASAWAPVPRVLATTIYAAAALALIAKGGPGERLFAFALMSASMVNVLMRYYRSPLILAASLLPYILVLGVVGWGLSIAAVQRGQLIGGLAAIFTIAMFVIQFWSARAQLADAWAELMSAREAAEERERAADAANRAKSHFLATMSHELRTPLNGVLGMAQALTTDPLTQLQKERVTIIRRSGESLLAVLNDLLDLSKIEASALELEAAEFDLEHLVRGLVAIYRPAAEKKGLSFEFEVAEAAKGRYIGDSARIRRILHSLADNAVKFTDAGAVALRVERDADTVVFRVADTGAGIAEDDLVHLFEGFFQADATFTRRHGGAGIGLAICRELASLMGGVVEASSKLGEGSTFTLTLPLALVPASAPRSEAPAQPATAPPELRVLAAEDNATNQLVLKTLLAQAGVEPTLVADGRQALAAWEARSWDIVLMDIQMPEMNGVDATRAIRAREAETGRARTPIVAVTANAMTDQLALYRAAGMDAVVPKPIDVANLFTVMEQALAEGGAESRRSSAA
jgi:signal transduction histidine kinase/CheY-like chemotaxis protein